MTQEALGMVETRGLTAAIEAADQTKNPPFCIDFLSVCQKAAALQQSQGAHFALGNRIDFLHLIAQLVIAPTSDSKSSRSSPIDSQ